MPKSNSTHEKKLVLALLGRLVSCRKDPSLCLLEDFDRIDPEVFRNYVERNEVGGMIYACFGEHPDCPAGIGDLKKHYQATALRNCKQLAELLNILHTFRENSIAVIPLKGVLDSDRIFGDLGSYPSNDIDVLVSPQHLDVVEKLLNEKGYFSPEEVSRTDLLASHYHLVFQRKSTNIEVHWNLVKRYFRIPAEFWWEGATSFTYENRILLEPASEKYLLYLVFRLFDHQFAPLKYWVHISVFINRSEELDYKKLEMYAGKYGMHLLLRFVLKFASDILDADVPAEYADRKIIGYSFLKRLVLKQNFEENLRPHWSMFLFTCFLLPPGKALPLSFSRVFASKSEIRLRYNIPRNSPKVYLYLLLNPLLLIFRRK